MTGRKTLVAGFVVVALCLATLATPPAVQSQIPDKFTNLKVLPKDISKQELMENMKSFAIGLGVRCQHCHMGEEGMPLSDFDFASDEKEAKIKARAMIQIRDEINDELLPKLGDLRSHSIQVACVTCHRGQPVPRMLEDVLLEVHGNEGVEAAIARYRNYREMYYGGFSYDFGEMTLVNVAGELTAGDPAAAVAILNLNLEFHPESWGTLVGLGDAHRTNGDPESALAAFNKAFEMRPHPMLKAKIDFLTDDD